MKKLLLCILFLLLAPNVYALPLSINIGANSSVVVKNETTVGWTSLAVNLVDGLEYSDFVLTGADPSHTIGFFTINVEGWFGLGSAEIQATLDFDDPNLQVVGNSVAGWGTFFGTLSATSLTWVNMLQAFTLYNGHIFTVDFEGFHDFNWSSNPGSEIIVHATVSAVEDTPAIPNPEPASIILMGTGLIGFAGFMRRKFKNK